LNHAEAATAAMLGTAGVIVRLWRLPEAAWAIGGAVALVAFGLLPIADAWTGVAKGADIISSWPA
jgi:arsenical pump membrane protein